MSELDALRAVRDEAYMNWREMVKNGEHEVAEPLGEAIDTVDEMIERLEQADDE